MCILINIFLTYIAPRLYQMLGTCCVVLLCLLVFPFLEEDFQRKYLRIFVVIFIILFLLILCISNIDTTENLQFLKDTLHCY